MSHNMGAGDQTQDLCKSESEPYFFVLFFGQGVTEPRLVSKSMFSQG